MKRFLKRLRTAQTRGQSLVEMAIIAPILIFFLLGIFEVGWALRNYLVLVNVNREITRFAIRPGYMDFSSAGVRNASYEQIKEWSEAVASDQIDLDFDNKSTLIISHLVIDTGLPCENMSACDCRWFDPDDSLYDPSKAFMLDDVIIHPGMPNYQYQTFTFGITETVTGEKTSRIDYAYWTARLTDQNNKFNCDIMAKGGLPSANNMVFTELFQDEPQLFGFPVISNPFTDPVPLYTHTVMRLIGGARGAGGTGGSLIANIDTIGEVCFAHPFIVSQIQLDALAPLQPGESIDILDGADAISGPGSQHKGWVLWNPNPTDPEGFLKYELRFPQTSVNSYEEPGSTGDTALNPGDTVASLQGAQMSAAVQELIQNLAGQTIVVPVWDDFDAGSATYTVSRFIEVNFNGVIVPTGPEVWATYVGPAPLACNSPES